MMTGDKWPIDAMGRVRGLTSGFGQRPTIGRMRWGRGVEFERGNCSIAPFLDITQFRDKANLGLVWVRAEMAAIPAMGEPSNCKSNCKRKLKLSVLQWVRRVCLVRWLLLSATTSFASACQWNDLNFLAHLLRQQLNRFLGGGQVNYLHRLRLKGRVARQFEGVSLAVLGWLGASNGTRGSGRTDGAYQLPTIGPSS